MESKKLIFSLEKMILQNCVRQWFEMKSNTSQFLKIISETFLARITFQKQKQTFISWGSERGAKRARALRGPPYGGPPPFVPHEMKVCFLLLKCGARQKSF